MRSGNSPLFKNIGSSPANAKNFSGMFERIADAEYSAGTGMEDAIESVEDSLEGVIETEEEKEEKERQKRIDAILDKEESE